jgi:hypothetical protein
VVRTAFLTAANLADVLVVPPHIVPANRAVGTLDEDAAASGPVAPAVASLGAVAVAQGQRLEREDICVPMKEKQGDLHCGIREAVVPAEVVDGVVAPRQ